MMTIDRALTYTFESQWLHSPVVAECVLPGNGPFGPSSYHRKSIKGIFKCQILQYFIQWCNIWSVNQFVRLCGPNMNEENLA